MKWSKDANEGAGGYVDYVNGSNELKDGQTQFVFKGLDAGKYKLVETKVPDGYSSVDDIEFEIISELDGKELKVLNTNSETFTAELSTGTVAATVINKTGSVLPSIGGAGAYAIYGIGGLLAVGGVMLMFTCRMSEEEFRGCRELICIYWEDSQARLASSRFSIHCIPIKEDT